MHLTDRYSVDQMPNGRVVVELADKAALILTPKQARTLATKLRNAARPRTMDELAEYLREEAVT